MKVKKTLKRRRGPRRSMHSIGDGIDLMLGKHQLTYLTMPTRNTIHIMTEIQRQIGHVHHLTAAKNRLQIEQLTPPGYPLE
jgi:hypothetical protein